MEHYEQIRSSMTKPTFEATLITVVLFVLSLVGSCFLFKFLQSTAVLRDVRWEAGGALVGFVILYKMMSVTVGRLRNPLLTSDQALALLMLWQDHQIGKYILWAFNLIDMQEKGDPLPSDDDLFRYVETIRLESRLTLQGFRASVGSLQEYLDRTFSERSFKSDFNKVMEIIRRDSPAYKKRYEIIKYAEHRKHVIANKYRRDLKKRKRLAIFSEG